HLSMGGEAIHEVVDAQPSAHQDFSGLLFSHRCLTPGHFVVYPARRQRTGAGYAETRAVDDRAGLSRVGGRAGGTPADDLPPVSRRLCLEASDRNLRSLNVDLRGTQLSTAHRCGFVVD